MTLVAELADHGVNPAEPPYDCLLEVDTDERQAVIAWTEHLQFHAEYNGPRELSSPGYGSVVTDDDWSPLVYEDGWLTPDAKRHFADKLAVIIREQTGHDLTVDTVDTGYDEPSITFEVVTDYRDGESYDAWLDRIGWPVVATLINATDPGTFNHPYLFSVKGN